MEIQSCGETKPAPGARLPRRIYLLIVITAGLACLLIAGHYHRIMRNARIISHLESHRAVFTYEQPSSTIELWLRSRFGSRYFGSVKSVYFLPGSTFTDEDARALSAFPNLTAISLRKTEIPPDAIECLAALPKLEFLDLAGSNADDAFVNDLLLVVRLKSLNVRDTPISESAIRRLAIAMKLDIIRLDRSQISGACRRYIEERNSHIELCVDD